MGDKLANYMNQYDFEPSQGVSGVRVGRVSGKWVTSITLHLNPGLTVDSPEYVSGFGQREHMMMMLYLHYLMSA